MMTKDDKILKEFLKGLSPEDEKLASEDVLYFGTAFVSLGKDGKKCRVAPCDVIESDDPGSR